MIPPEADAVGRMGGGNHFTKGSGAAEWSDAPSGRWSRTVRDDPVGS